MSVELDSDSKLPALRETSALANFEESLAGELQGFLLFLREQLLLGIEQMADETRTRLAEGDPAQRIALVNRMRLQKNRMEAHLVKEITEIRDLARALRDKGQADKAVIESLNTTMKETGRTVMAALNRLVQEFGLD